MTTRPMPYSLTLTRAEYRAAAFMCDRGYLGDLLNRATETDWDDAEEAVTLRFAESDIWGWRDAAGEDDEQPDAENDRADFWALTTPSTTLGAKVRTLLDSIV